MSVVVIDFQNATFEHELFNTGLFESLIERCGEVTIWASSSLGAYYARTFPQLHARLRWKDLDTDSVGGFSLIGASRLARSLIQSVDSSVEVVLFTTTTPAALIAARLVLKRLKRTSPQLRICFIFHGMLANLERKLSDRPDPWLRITKHGLPLFYPGRLVLSLDFVLKALSATRDKESIFFGFLTTKARSLFSEKYRFSLDRLLFTPICISSELSPQASHLARLPRKRQHLRVGVLGWNSPECLKDLAQCNPDTSFNIFGRTEISELTNVELQGDDLDRAAIFEAASLNDVFILPRKTPPSEWSLSGIPAEMLLFQRKLIVPNGMKVEHYGLPSYVVVEERQVMEPGSKKLRQDLDPCDFYLDPERTAVTRESLRELLSKSIDVISGRGGSVGSNSNNT